MNQMVFAGITDRLADNLRSRNKDMGPEAKTRLVAEYTDPQRYAQEIKGLFRELPVVVAHSSQLANPGDFIAHDRLGVPIIVTRTQGGALAAHLNVCPHRNAVVETEECGNRSAFVCPYHNWTFGLDGVAKNIPDPASFDGVDKARLNLRPIAVAEKYGLVFVRLSPGGPIDLDTYLAPVAHDLEAFGVETHSFFSSRITPLKANWKVMSEGSLETYHFAATHATSIAPHFASMATIHDAYEGHHQRFVVPNRRLLDGLEKGADPRPYWLPTVFIFPNTYLTFPHDHMTLTQVFPTGVGSCIFHNALLVNGPPPSEEKRAYWDKALDVTEGVNDQDFVVVESIQKTYDTAPAEVVIHGRYEQGLTLFHQAVDAVVGPFRP